MLSDFVQYVRSQIGGYLSRTGSHRTFLCWRPAIAPILTCPTAAVQHHPEDASAGVADLCPKIGDLMTGFQLGVNNLQLAGSTSFRGDIKGVFDQVKC